MTPKSSRTRAHFPPGLPRQPGKSSFDIIHWRCHQGSKRPPSRSQPAQNKSHKRWRMSRHCLKTHQRPPKQAVPMTSTNTFLLVIWHYALRATPGSFQMDFLFHLSVLQLFYSTSPSNTPNLIEIEQSLDFILLQYPQSSVTSCVRQILMGYTKVPLPPLFSFLSYTEKCCLRLESCAGTSPPQRVLSRSSLSSK